MTPQKNHHRTGLFLFGLIFLFGLLSCVIPVELPISATHTPTSTTTPRATATPPFTPTSTPTPSHSPTPLYDGPEEIIPHWIELSGVIAEPEAEISGMAWYGETLILLPQFPEFARDQLGIAVVFAIEKASILNYLSEEDPLPLTPAAWTFNFNGLEGAIYGYEGFEAIAFYQDTFYITLEATNTYGTYGILIQGTIDPINQQLTLLPGSQQRIDPQTGISNLSDEALLFFNNQIYTFYEANGINFNPSPLTHRFDLSLYPLTSLPFPHIEYRLTDATSADASGFFWVINVSNIANAYFMPESDPIADQYGQGQTHAQFELVERLLLMQITDQGIQLVDRAPIQLNLTAGYVMRNWEGIVRMDEMGFLLATDKYPTTLLAFIPFENAPVP